MKQPSKSKSNNSILEKNKGKLPTKLKDDGKHYSCNKFYSYTDIALGLIDGGRGIGKTTTFLNKGLLNTNKGEEFVYLRRYKPEIKKFVNKDSFKPMIDGVRYVGDGTGGYTAYFEDRLLGYLICLSTARSYKSVDFSKVTLIIFDEGFVRQTANYRYLNDEVTQFLEFCSTVIRTRTNVKIVILGNHEDMFSPYHAYWNIKPFEHIYIDAEHKIYCEHAVNSAKLLEDERKTGFFHLIKDTSYGSYHYDNELLTQNKVNIIDKPNNCRLVFRVIINNQTCNMYVYNDSRGDIRMYCEHRDKAIKDRVSYEIMNEGKFNYLNIDLFKQKIKKFLYSFYFNNKIDYSNDKGGAIISWTIENT